MSSAKPQLRGTFKSVTGQTISQYVHAQRIKRAVYLLTESR